ncbi:MAG: hypothetical protein N2545_00160, partial [Thermoflexales bacterium]|nr:hypothetical protein [Thermoflexales bacterium]
MTTNLERRPRWLRVVLSTLLLTAQALPTTAQAYQLQLTTWDVEHAAPAVATVLPAWFAGAQAADPAVEVLPSWFEGDASQPESPAGFTPLVNASEGSAQVGSQTIFANQVTVTVSPPQISLCDPLTVTVVAANNNVTTTGVLITVTLPGGFTSNSAVFNVGAVAPNAVITRTAVFTATCSAVSGQVVVTLTQDAYPPIIKIAEYVVNPGAITVRKEPAVVPAAVGDVVTWTVIVENTGYG